MLPHNYKIKTQPDLFMAWDKDIGDFADPAEYARICHLTENPWGDDGQMHIQAFGRYTKLNYIGLDDKNGDQIFEGFILRVKFKQGEQKYTIIGVVEFENCGFVLTDPNNVVYAMSAFTPDEIEIIGNIFQNRNSLKEE